MEIRKSVVKQLEQLVNRKPEEVPGVILPSSQQEGYIVTVPARENSPNISVVLQDYDRYSVILRKLEVNVDSSPLHKNEGETYLRHCAEEITNRLTYFEEPMTLFELDTAAGQAQLRTEPIQENEAVIYWEAFIETGSKPKVTLTRYRWTPGHRQREAIGYPAAFVLVGRIATDLAESLLNQTN
jgi:hypothetical protein